MTSKIKIHLADDHQVLIDGLSNLLQTVSNFEVAGTSLDGTTVYDDVVKDLADVLILDISMPKKDGIETLKEFREKDSTCKVIILSSYDDLKIIKEVMKLGAKAYLTKNCAGENIIEAVKAAKQKVTLIGFAGMPSHLLASFNSKPTYMYQFSHIPPDKPNFPNFGAFHTSEVPYTLHTLHTWKRPWQQLDRDLENTISSYWVNFAKTGNPNGANLPEWKTYDKQSGNIISLSDKVELKAAFLKKEFDFLEDK